MEASDNESNYINNNNTNNNNSNTVVCAAFYYLLIKLYDSVSKYVDQKIHTQKAAYNTRIQR
jgi:hypothetical protein